MRNYVIINGVNSLDIQGLAINNLPPITKPMIRTQREEIDGRDGDIVTELGYSSYDKQMEIGLYGNFDIDAIIKYFTGEGTIVFSNEEDKYYNFKILDQIDYEKLLKFKTATITLHCQPFKYPLEEEPVEAEITTITGTGEYITLEDTEEAPMKIVYKGNTYQKTTNNLMNLNVVGPSGTQYNIKEPTITNGVVNVQGKNDTSYDTKGKYQNGYVTIGTTQKWVENKTYYISFKLQIVSNPKNLTTDYFIIGLFGGRFENIRYNSNTGRYEGSITTTSISDSDKEKTIIEFRVDGMELNISEISLKETEDYTFNGYGISPTPDIPSHIHVVSGDNSIEICGKNLFDKDNAKHYSTDGSGNTTTTNYFNSTDYIPCNANESFTISGIPKTQSDFNFKVIFFDSNKNYISRPIAQFGTIGTRSNFSTTAPSNAKYVMAQFQNNIEEAQFEKGTSTTYEPYQKESYPIYLGDIELCEIGNYQDRIDKSTGKNLVEDKIINGTIGSAGNIGVNASYDMFIAKVEENKTYTVTTDENGLVGGFFYDKPTTGSVSYNSSRIVQSNKTFTAPITGYIAFRTNVNYSTPMLNEGTTALPYEPYGTGWYVKKEIGKVVLDGSESWNVSNTGTPNYIYYAYINNFKLLTTGGYSNYYTFISIGGSDTNQGIFAVNDYVRIRYGTEDTVANFKTWLSSHNVELYYILNTPTYTEITDSTLISQLNALEGARSYDNQTNISQANNDLPFELDVSVTFLSLMGINNIGNIYAKPILTIEGTGNIGVILNGIQILEIDLSNNGKITIDVPKLEAYDPDDNTLLNRLVTGDYMKLLINEGENKITFTGEVSGATLTNYIRWI